MHGGNRKKGVTTISSPLPPTVLPDGYDPPKLKKQIGRFPRQGADVPKWLEYLNKELSTWEIVRLKSALEELGYLLEWGAEGLRIQRNPHRSK